MKLEYIPLLRIQRELQGLPRNQDRFRQYLRTISPDGSNLELPSLVIMNPMGKDHVTALLDELIALDADVVAAQAIADASVGLAEAPGEFKASLVLPRDNPEVDRHEYSITGRFTLRGFACAR